MVKALAASSGVDVATGESSNNGRHGGFARAVVYCSRADANANSKGTQAFDFLQASTFDNSQLLIESAPNSNAWNSNACVPFEYFE
jgi:hypothetical protein